MRTLVEDLIAVCLCYKGHARVDDEQDHEVSSNLTAESL
jgi:hypothetical protein